MQKQIQINNGYGILAIKSRFLSKTEKSGNKEDLVQAKTFFLKYIFFFVLDFSCLPAISVFSRVLSLLHQRQEGEGTK